jgi:hypothetical protein
MVASVNDLAEKKEKARMNRGIRLVSIAVAVGLLAACASETENPRPRQVSGHVSPPPVTPAKLPAGTFDRDKAQGELAAARTAQQAGDLHQAKILTEAAINHWPGDIDAWTELLAVDQALNDADGVHYATFFHDKIDFVNPLPPRIAVMGFQSMADAGSDRQDKDVRHDPQTIAMAGRLASFYNEIDPMVPQRDASMPQRFTERNPYAMPIIGAAGAGLVAGMTATGVK